MATTTFDTLGAAKRLEEAGFERERAEAIVKEIHEGRGELATKADIQELKTGINWLKFLAVAQITVVVLATIVIINFQN